MPRVANDADARFEKIESLFLRVEGDPKLAVLVLVPARADAEDDATARQNVNRCGDFGQYPGGTKGHRTDHRSELDPLGPLGGERERGPALDAVAFGSVHQGDEVVASAQGVAREGVGVFTDAAPPLPAQALLALDHDPNLRHLFRS